MSGKAIGRPKVPAEKSAAVRAALVTGNWITRVARAVEVGNGTVQQIAREMSAA
jgi:transposase-like protein